MHGPEDSLLPPFFCFLFLLFWIGLSLKTCQNFWQKLWGSRLVGLEVHIWDEVIWMSVVPKTGHILLIFESSLRPLLQV